MVYSLRQGEKGVDGDDDDDDSHVCYALSITKGMRWPFHPTCTPVQQKPHSIGLAVAYYFGNETLIP